MDIACCYVTAEHKHYHEHQIDLISWNSQEEVLFFR